MSDEQPVEKTSRWTDAERERANVAEPTGPPPPTPLFDGTADPKMPEPPLWLGAFFPGTVLTHKGWNAVVRHVGEQEGHWLVLLEPTTQVVERVMSRSEYRRLKTQLGKKGVEKVLQERKATVAGPPIED